MLPFLRRRLTSSITRAENVRDEYVRLASELKKAVSEGETELRIVKLELDQKRENATMSKEAAEKLKKVGPASVMGTYISLPTHNTAYTKAIFIMLAVVFIAKYGLLLHACN